MLVSVFFCVAHKGVCVDGLAVGRVTARGQRDAQRDKYISPIHTYPCRQALNVCVCVTARCVSRCCWAIPGEKLQQAVAVGLEGESPECPAGIRPATLLKLPSNDYDSLHIQLKTGWGE